MSSEPEEEDHSLLPIHLGLVDAIDASLERAVSSALESLSRGIIELTVWCRVVSSTEGDWRESMLPNAKGPSKGKGKAKAPVKATRGTASFNTFERLSQAFLKRRSDGLERQENSQPEGTTEDYSCPQAGADEDTGDDTDAPNKESDKEPGPSRPWHPERGVKKSLLEVPHTQDSADI